MMHMNRIGFLGGGKMAQALANGFIKAGLIKATNIMASVHPKDEENLKSIQALGALAVVQNLPVVEQSDIIFVAVKPGIVSNVLMDVRSSSDHKLFISLAMGITLAELQKNLSRNARVIRAMPNIPVMVQEGCSVYVRGQNVTDADAKTAQTLLQSVGTCEEVVESFLDPITALSGSGPAYIFVLIEALADGAVNMGLPRDLSYRLASQAVLGSAKMMRDSKIHPAQLKDDVTSPGGSTAAGLSHLEKTSFRAAAAGAVVAATLRCKEISGS